MEADALLLGRKTYESFAGAWPEREGEFADKLNEMPKYLVSSTITDPDWNNTTRLEGDVAEAVRKLRDEFDGIIQVPGSKQLVDELMENDLVDQVNLMIFPVVLGTGFRVFGEYSDRKVMRLVESKTVGDGIVVLVYERA
jgi:dihydrofolate reductase